MTLLEWLAPWEFSPSLLFVFAISGFLFWRGSQVHYVQASRQWLFWIGWIALYLNLHTMVDYYSERMFFIHRIQHLFLHHLLPLLIMLSYPGQVMRAALPLSWRRKWRDFRRGTVGAVLVRGLTHPVLVPLLFVFFVLVWLLPTAQFYSMIDWRLYRFMNWSVVITGFMYWNLIVDRRPSPPAAMRPWGRVVSPLLTMAPQVVAGIYITFVSYDLYPIFDLCGRALPGFDALKDQAIGGLVMWVAAGAVEMFGFVYAMATVIRLSAKGRLQSDLMTRLQKAKSMDLSSSKG